MFRVGDKVRFCWDVGRYYEGEIVSVDSPELLTIKEDGFHHRIKVGRVSHIWLRNRWFALEG